MLGILVILQNRRRGASLNLMLLIVLLKNSKLAISLRFDEEKTVYSENVDSSICILSETSSVSGISEADLEKMKVD